MIIIVEGIDRVGKSTLCEKLKEKYGLPVFKFNPLFPISSRQRNAEVSNCMLQMVEAMGGDKVNVVFDRFTMSEFVYGLMDRNYNSIAECRAIEDRLFKMNSLLIYVKPTDVAESSKQHGHDLRMHDVLCRDYFSSWPGCKIAVDYTSMNTAVDIVGCMLEEASNV